jgi:glycosyltransferase involved in cell wall biosynthesis
MIGDGQMRGHIQKLISDYQLQDKVILAGWRRDIPQILSALDIFVLTSLYEGLPIAVLEAMASAKAVVATHTGGIAEVIKDGENGFLIAPKEPQELADKVFSLLNDVNLRKRLGENARLSIAGSFSVTSMVLAHQKVYLKSSSYSD